MLSDPICALATPPGRSALAVVRLSGNGAFGIARRILCMPDDAPLPPYRSATRATWYDATGPIDSGLVVFFRGPASYTGEDLVEFSGHGGVLAPARLLAALEAGGARQAGPGEFTRRALEHGKIDLLQAEAIGDLIDATAPIQARAALAQMEGGLSRRIERLRSDLIELEALLSYEIDFPEEDDGPIDRGRIDSAFETAVGATDALLATAPIGTKLRTGALVVLAGRPNVGKSSLFNALVGEERALVTEVPGTTRDAIEAPGQVEGWPIRLVDTAGLRDSDDRVERMGVEVSRRYLAAADLVLICVEGGRELDQEELALEASHPAIVVRTKSDLQAAPGLAVSALTGQGLGDLRRELGERLFARRIGPESLEPMLTQERHRHALAAARQALIDARGRLGDGDPAIVAHQVRSAVDQLDSLIGVVVVDDVLDRLFARFCIGK
ncbi:MAG: tRNA uridine-5-carboxymethylaminomethyl(34) synthesis GTPase MnmE [Gemmatimonadales bacterium]